jgi:ATP-dependent Lon protease
VAKQVKSHGLEDKNVNFSDEALSDIVRRYTREAGVRNLEREINSSSARSRARSCSKARLHRDHHRARTCPTTWACRASGSRCAGGANEIGTATGLAWTEVGGEILAIEVTLMPGKGALTLTGKLGDVMQESAQAAHVVRALAARVLGHPARFNRRLDIHIHVPEAPSQGRPLRRHHHGDRRSCSALTKIPVGATWP